MLCLKTLGSPVVEGSRGPLPGTAGQPKALALLALLAVAYQRGLSRDRLVGYLWPEVPPKTAAHRLNQLLYALRRDLGCKPGHRAPPSGSRGRPRPAWSSTACSMSWVGRTRASTSWAPPTCTIRRPTAGGTAAHCPPRAPSWPAVRSAGASTLSLDSPRVPSTRRTHHDRRLGVTLRPLALGVPGRTLVHPTTGPP